MTPSPMPRRHARVRLGGAAAAILLAGVLPPTAIAEAFVRHERRLTSPAIDTCQAALPAYEGLIRKRPLGITNEGAATAFVTCSFLRMTGEWLEDPRQVVLQLRLGPDGAPLTCTGVRSWETVARTVGGSPDGHASMIWAGEHFAPSPQPGTIWGNFSVSCALPPGASVMVSESIYADWYEL